MRYQSVGFLALLLAAALVPEASLGGGPWQEFAARGCRATVLASSGTSSRGFGENLDQWKVENPRLEIVFTETFEGSSEAAAHARFYLGRAADKANAAVMKGESPQHPIVLGVPQGGVKVPFGGVVVFCQKVLPLEVEKR